MTARAPPVAVPVLRIVVDDRERNAGLPRTLAALWRPTLVGRLPVGDAEVGPRVIVERKTVADFAASLADRRLFRQAAALARVAVRPLLVVEGEDALAATGLEPRALRGVLLALLVGFRLPLLRTSSVEETALTLARIARQERRRLAGRPRPPRPTPARRALDVLAAIPGIGDERARRLLADFGSVQAVACAGEADLAETEGIGPHLAGVLRAAFAPPQLGARQER